MCLVCYVVLYHDKKIDLDSTDANFLRYLNAWRITPRVNCVLLKVMNCAQETVDAFQCFINAFSMEPWRLHSDDRSSKSEPTAVWEDFLLTFSRNPQLAESPSASRAPPPLPEPFHSLFLANTLSNHRLHSRQQLPAAVPYLSSTLQEAWFHN